ncbi:cytochrome P450 71A4-like protein [Tanacetum coccineum]
MQKLLANIMVLFSSLETFLVSLITFITLMLVISFEWINAFHSENKKRFPPSPPKLPLIGNLLQLGSIPHRSLRDLSEKYGPLMLLHLGNKPTLVVTSADVAREVMKTHDLAFSDRPSLSIPNILFYGSTDIAFSRYGENWRKLKSIVVLHLLSSTRVKSFRQVREEEIGHMISVLGERRGSIIDLSALLYCLTSNILCRVAFGRKYEGLGITDKVNQCMDMLGAFCVGNHIPWLSWIDRLTGLEGRAQKLSIELDHFLEGVFDEHLNKETREDAQGEMARNFVDTLQDIQRDNANSFNLHTTTLKAVIMDVFVAGFDTTFISLDWAMSELIRHPRVMKKLQQEVTEIANGRPMIPEEDLEKMKYLKAVVKETLRLHPPLPLLVTRESREEVNLMGYAIPPCTQVIINNWAIGRDPALWKESEDFKPERFFNNSIDYKGLHFEFLPFGAGRRGCPGIYFAEAIIELILANIIYMFNFTLPNEVEAADLDMAEKNDITMKRKSPLLVMATPRL